MHFCQQPPPHPRLRKEIPIHFCRQPPPRPRLRRRIPIHLCRHPPPRPRLRRSSPAPAGRGQCVAISGEQPYPGCNRGEAVFGSSPAYSRALDRVDIAIGGGGPRGGGTRSPSLVSHAPSTLLLVAGISARDTHALLPAAPTPPAPSALLPRPAGRGQCVAISGEQPYLGCNRWEAVHWTVGISPRGVGLTGRGNSFPLPCLSRSKHLASRCRHFCEGYPGTSAGTPTPPAPSALLPRPHPGAGSVRGDIRGAAVPGVEPVGHRARLFSRISPYAGPWGYRHWGRRPAGRGNLFPLPCLSRSRHLAPCQPYPARPSAGRLPMHFCRQPPPRPRLRRSAPSPAGRGQCSRYLVESRIRGATGGPPCPALLQDLPICWTVGISPLGEGPTGRGNLFPLPCLSRSRYLAPRQPYPARPSAGRLPMHFCRHPPPRPRLRRSSPAPSRQAGSVRGDTWWAAVSRVQPVGSRIRFFSRISPCAGPWGYRHWGRRPAGRGNLFPLPCLSRSKHLASRRHPHTARACGAPPPPRQAGAVLAIPGGKPYPGCNRWATVPGSSPGSPHAVDRGDIAIGGGGPRGGGTCSPSPVSHTPDTLLLASPIPPGLQPAGYPYTPPAPPPLPSPGSLTIRAKSQKEMGAAGELRRQRRGL